ncbi:MAG: A/G-specific adenine glycosylase [Candidatus Eremiobacteraeota bacterium]|nr:A/G-specific adenine glycosylase [Candidatus Eremiobacteraeota bacterium]
MTRLQRALLSWYRRSGRKSLPWRQTRDPYQILVSEFMLQQTQVDRVIPSFHRFLKQFPNFAALAAARTSDVVRAWKGLGYNTRAVRLKRIAEEVVNDHGGSLPIENKALRAMLGIGAYTASAVRVFAFDRNDVAFDANVRRVVRRLVFGRADSVSEALLQAQAHSLLPHGSAHAWNSALMDLGALICTARAPSCSTCPVEDFCAAAPLEPTRKEAPTRGAKPTQERIPFPLTTRFARGRIVDRLRALPDGQRISLFDLRSELSGVLATASLELVEPLIVQLERDGIVQRDGDLVALSD